MSMVPAKGPSRKTWLRESAATVVSQERSSEP
jgi:hypothetical protein